MMKTSFRIGVLLFIGIVVLASCSSTPVASESNVPSFYKKPQLDTSRYNVAFLIMDGVYNTELTAPFDIFQHTIFRRGIKPMNTFLVADTYNHVESFEGIRMVPDFNYLKDDIPPIDILVVPSAEHHLDTDLENKTMIDWVAKVGQSAKYITSHCDGAFVLAKAGLLENRVCTTFPSDIDLFKKSFPHLDVRSEVLFVHDDNVITSAGGAKSFEAALYLAELLYGKEIAQSLAGGLVIDWQLEKVPHIVVE